MYLKKFEAYANHSLLDRFNIFYILSSFAVFDSFDGFKVFVDLEVYNQLLSNELADLLNIELLEL